METYTVTAFWKNGRFTEDKGMTKEGVLHTVSFCLGDTCVGFEIDLEENE